MKVKFEVLGCGFHEGRTKDGRTWQRLRMMGFAYDCDGNKIPATCDMGYDAKLDSQPSAGDLVVVDMTSFDMRNAMGAIVFSTLSHSVGARESKH